MTAADPESPIVSREEAEGYAIDRHPAGYFNTDSERTLARSLVVAYECIDRLRGGWGVSASGDHWTYAPNGYATAVEPMTTEQQAVMSRG